MRILLTGASSFTGFWFARDLVKAGHDVLATLQGSLDSYAGLRGERVHLLEKAGVQLVPDCSFGDHAFIEIIKGGIDILCHHGANVTNYKSMDFDVTAAVSDNSRNIREVIETGKETGLKGLVITGSVFEQNEGLGNLPRRAFSPYGLSKGLTSQIFEYWTTITSLPLYKFVIPNPFGPFEEPRFCAYLMKTWVKGETPSINTPDYIRDNIHISLLSKSYVDLVRKAEWENSPSKASPSGYVESQGAFALRFSKEIGSRLKIQTPLILNKQSDFTEPYSRVNSDNPSINTLDWDETSSWDELADFYQKVYL